MRRNSIVTAALALIALFAVAGCSGQPLSTREKGTLGGAGIGAVAGAIVGANQRRHCCTYWSSSAACV